MVRGWEAVAAGWPVLDFHYPFRPLLQCYNIHLLLSPLVFILTIAYVLLLLPPHLSLLSRPFINEESVERMANELAFVCHASTGIETTLLTELGL